MVKRRPEIELRHLRYYLAAVEYGSFRKAGGALGINESAISRRIRDLEDQLGASLFQRYNGGVRLTLAGERFLVRARDALRDIEAGACDVAAIGRLESGRIRIGVAPGPASSFLMDLLRSYDRSHAGVRLEFMEGDAAEQVAAIRHRDIDVAFVAGSGGWDGCEAMPLWTEPVFAVLPDGHHLVDQAELEWCHIAGEYFIGDRSVGGGKEFISVEERHARMEQFIIPAWSGRRYREHLPLVALGRGVMLTFATKIAATWSGIVFRPIVGEALPFGAVWLQDNDNPALRRLLAMARRQSDRSRC